MDDASFGRIRQKKMQDAKAKKGLTKNKKCRKTKRLCKEKKIIVLEIK